MTPPQPPDLAWRPSPEAIRQAAVRLQSVVVDTPLERDENLSEEYGAEILLKREDLQPVRSYKIRGAYNKIRSCSDEELARGVSCASAGNHAQGVAFACRHLGIHGTIYMPQTAPNQKVERVRAIGRDRVDIVLTGDVYDDTEREALEKSAADGSVFVHPFDDPQVIEGQATVGKEILDDAPGPIDIVFLPVGGGGLAAGVGSWIKSVSPRTEIIGVEPAGAPSMVAAFAAGHVVTLDTIDPFTDGAAVRTVGKRTFAICQDVLDRVVTVPEGRICSMILRMYNDHGIIVEPAGALAVAALEDFRSEVAGKRVVAIVSGGNNDFRRIEEIRERALIYEGRKHYFIVRFPQRAGALRQFLNEVLGPHDDITHFQYSKKTDRERGPAVVGLELRSREDLEPLMGRMKALGFFGEYLNEQPDLMRYLV
jgi:threonine dehydratase